MRVIGVSINEAIDWAQDRLLTTRPLAERTLFSLLAERLVTETEGGFLLVEDDDEEVKKRHHMHVRKGNTGHRQHHSRHRRLRIRQNTGVEPADETEQDEAS